MGEERSSQERITELARQFPTLENLAMVKDWDALALDEWARGGRSHGEKLAAQFVLSVWSSLDAWECGPFNLFEAYGVWDHDHWEAFQKWVAKPFIL